MASNELRARLVGHAMPWGEEIVFSNRENGKHRSWMESPMPYDSDRNACAELLEYCDQQYRALVFLKALRLLIWPPELVGDNWSDHGRDAFQILTATPAQICAAFDATFAKELAELENKHGK